MPIESPDKEILFQGHWTELVPQMLNVGDQTSGTPQAWDYTWIIPKGVLVWPERGLHLLSCPFIPPDGHDHSADNRTPHLETALAGRFDGKWLPSLTCGLHDSQA